MLIPDMTNKEWQEYNIRGEISTIKLELFSISYSNLAPQNQEYIALLKNRLDTLREQLNNLKNNS